MKQKKQKIMKAIKFEISFGVVPGFTDSTTQNDIAIESVVRAWEEAAADVMEQKGLFVSAQFSAAQVIYPFGLDIISETVVSVSGISNPKFQANDIYREAVRLISEYVKTGLKQNTATLQLSEVESYRI